MTKPLTTSQQLAEQARNALRIFLETSPEIGVWLLGTFSPAQRDAYARARGWAQESLKR